MSRRVSFPTLTRLLERRTGLRLHLLQMAYCEEEVECRRVMILTHFGETSFAASQCKGTCDLCIRNQTKSFEKRDMTEAAQDAVKVRPSRELYSLQ